VVRYIFPFRSRGRGSPSSRRRPHSWTRWSALATHFSGACAAAVWAGPEGAPPGAGLFLVTDSPLEQVAGEETEDFDRLFHRQDYYRELHLSILKGVGDRAETPFLTALRSVQPQAHRGLSRPSDREGKSILKSRWIRDTATFFGPSGFTGETSATTGGLDSLLQPHGPLKRAQELAARAFGARKTYFVTNGTSTANKIVMQGLVRPGDIVLLAHDCHKSHPYAVIMSGALPVYLDAYPLSEYSMYGGVPLSEIKRELLELRRAGKAGPGEDAPADEHHLRRHHLRSRAGHGRGAGHQARHGVRVGRGLVRLRPLPPDLRRRTAMEAARRLEERLRRAPTGNVRGWSAQFQGHRGA
jgi:arginine decarboxylase